MNSEDGSNLALLFPVQETQKYTDLEYLSQGAMGTTYTALDPDGKRVLLKKLHFAMHEGMSPGEVWDYFKLFKREAEVLQKLDHPAIPHLLASYACKDGKETCLYIAQELMPGKNLEKLLKEGRRFSEEDARHIATEVLEALMYSHSQTPPILHRDIKPGNILLDDNNKVSLVDFGSVGYVLSTSTGGSTIAGTPGYAPMEQLLGKAVPSSDIYSLGATLAKILSGKDPADMIEKGRLDIRKHVSASEGLINILLKMTEPNADSRYAGAKEVIDALKIRDEQTTTTTNISVAAPFQIMLTEQSEKEYERAVQKKAEEISDVLMYVLKLARNEFGMKGQGFWKCENFELHRQGNPDTFWQIPVSHLERSGYPNPVIEIEYFDEKTMRLGFRCAHTLYCISLTGVARDDSNARFFFPDEHRRLIVAGGIDYAAENELFSKNYGYRIRKLYTKGINDLLDKALQQKINHHEIILQSLLELPQAIRKDVTRIEQEMEKYFGAKRETVAQRIKKLGP